MPDANGSSLHLGLATEGASVLSVLADFNFLHHFPEGGTIAGPVFSDDPDLSSALRYLGGARWPISRWTSSSGSAERRPRDGSVSDQELEASDLELGSSIVFLANQLAQPPSSRDLTPGRRLASQMLGSSWVSKMPGKSFCRKMPGFGSKEKYRMPERC